MSRRNAISQGLAVLAVTSGASGIAGAQHAGHVTPPPRPQPSVPVDALAVARVRRRVSPGLPGRDYTPVITPNGETLPFRIVDGVKVFHLTTGEFDHEFAPGLTGKCWGYNGRTIGPTIEVVEGDRVRIYVTNRLPEPTSVHWHGIILPSGMDGVSGLSQAPIPPGETYLYEFDLNQYGTYMYHPHYDEMTQQALGMMGMLVVHERGERRRPDKDFVMLSSEWRIGIGTSRPDPNEMVDFNVLTFNSKAFPGTAPLVIQLNDDVRVRFGNLSAMSHHPIHVHGLAWRVVATDGGPIDAAGQWPETTVLVPVGTTRTVEFTATNPGDWAMHCHMTHHTMNQMGHSGVNFVGAEAARIDAAARDLLPSYMTMGQTGMGDHAVMGMPVPRNSIPMLGREGPKGYIDMGGMFTILKVREQVTSQVDPGWYADPPGTVARRANQVELERDGVRVS
ncbi:MAG: copper oxidase [Gemmatimonadetes bacterium]|nr:copper oxidase [Gemmatimonadota bacterium]